jgi:hypothetical protein
LEVIVYHGLLSGAISCGLQKDHIISWQSLHCRIQQATFTVLIEAPAHLVVLSNMPEAARSNLPASSSSSSSRVLVEFLPTPLMSTYLLSVAVGDVQAVTSRTNR